MHIPSKEAKKAKTMVAKIMVTTRPEVVRLFWRTMQVVSPAGWIWQIRPGAQEMIGVKVGMQFVPVAELAPVVVRHQVMEDWEVVRQTRAVPLVEEEDEEVVVEDVVKDEVVELGVVEACVELAVVVWVEGVSVVVAAAVDGESVVEGVALD